MKQHVISASQWNTFNLCQRLWAYQYIEGLRSEPGAGALLGSAVHKVLEGWGRTGEWEGDDRPLKLAVSAKDFLSERENLTGIERFFKFTADKVPYRGYLDFEEEGLYGDYKTSSNPRKYGLTAETILDDTQALIYAREYFESHPENEVNARWLYIPTKSGKAYAIDAVFTREHVLRAFKERITPLSLKILEAKKNCTKADDLPYNRKACNKYGGCSHIPYCNRGSVLETLEKSNMPSLRERLAKKPGMKPPPASAFKGPKLPPQNQPRINAPENANLTVEEKINGSKATLAEMEKPKDHKVVALIREGFDTFTRVRADETEALPYVGMRTWNALVRKGEVEFEQDGDIVRASLPGTKVEVALGSTGGAASVEDISKIATREQLDRMEALGNELLEFVSEIRGTS